MHIWAYGQRRMIAYFDSLTIKYMYLWSSKVGLSLCCRLWCYLTELGLMTQAFYTPLFFLPCPFGVLVHWGSWHVAVTSTADAIKTPHVHQLATTGSANPNGPRQTRVKTGHKHGGHNGPPSPSPHEYLLIPTSGGAALLQGLVFGAMKSALSSNRGWVVNRRAGNATPCSATSPLWQGVVPTRPLSQCPSMVHLSPSRGHQWLLRRAFNATLPPP